MAKRTAAQKARTVAHHHKHVKPAHAHHKAATGHAHKHHKAAKHHKVAHKHKGQVHRGLAPAADQVASCAAEALAASLRLSGLSVAPVDVLELYWHTASDPDAGASILATLKAASEFGMAGFRPAGFCREPLENAGRDVIPDLIGREVAILNEDLSGEPQALDGIIALTADSRMLGGRGMPGQFPHARQPMSLVLGVDLPGPHAVLATPEGWWSWGELWCPWCEWPDAVIEEAWEVSWR